jgi:hypothetical protein
MNATQHRSKGLSLILVTATVAVASVMGIAILSSNALQVEASTNQDKAVQADALSESGVNLAMYYLQNISDSSKCPAGLSGLAVNGTPYTSLNNSLGASVSGTFDIQVSHTSTNQYKIVSIGKATVSGSTIKRTITGTVDLNYYGYGISAPNISAGSWTIPAGTTIVGDVYSNTSVVNNGSISGNLYASSSSGTGSTGLLKSLTSVISSTLIPTTATVNHYVTYTYNGGIYTAGTILSPQSNVTLGTTVTNPAGIYVCATTLDITGNFKVNGTLVVSTGGSLRIQGTGNSITPVSGFPAQVVDGDIIFKANNAAVDLNGLTFLGGSVKRSASQTGCKLNVTGALLCPSITNTFDGAVTTTIKYDRTKASVTTLVSGSTKPTPSSVSIVSWKN